YSTYSDQHVLNVQTRNMSAFVDDPDHFLNWVKETASTTIRQELPAHIACNFTRYGKYIDHIYQNALKSKPEHVSLRIINEEVIDLDEKENRVEVITSAGKY
ncbi:MAG: FAD/NAD(P)-binding protein, partial [Bacteroidetes bacterium]|nr:FAD/NAD(P)-binding protein [Bacteroidota bacterium]